ncbi:hypothetical protein EDC26_11476 [Paralcaligenes ureilyticus]|uniref:Uncharacterized protein n=1 Tax=Paralcaligenes ureilyticus TaxID=627131 RepID=A0A4V2UXK0_9BURK|nr:hypothetical protein EDC26_11476 [Paralcaligenes ureilyticus]
MSSRNNHMNKIGMVFFDLFVQYWIALVFNGPEAWTMVATRAAATKK